MNTEISKIRSIAEAARSILSEGYGDAQYGPAARNKDSRDSAREMDSFIDSSKKSYQAEKDKENKAIEKLKDAGFKFYKDQSEEVVKKLKAGVMVAWEQDMFLKTRYGPIPPEVALSGTTKFASAYKPKKLKDSDLRYKFSNLGSIWIKET